MDLSSGPLSQTDMQQINYGGVNNAQNSAIPADDFVTMMKDPLFLGDANIDSQHMLGLSKWTRVAEDEIKSQHQSRAAHVRWNEGRKTIAAKGHGHGLVTTTYKRIDGVWKWAGIETKVRWNEHEFERVFLGSAGKFDNEGKIDEKFSAVTVNTVEVAEL